MKFVKKLIEQSTTIQRLQIQFRNRVYNDTIETEMKIDSTMTTAQKGLT